MNECSGASRAELDLDWTSGRLGEDEEEFHSSDEAIDEEGQAETSSTDRVHCCSRCSCVYGTCEKEIFIFCLTHD